MVQSSFLEVEHLSNQFDYQACAQSDRLNLRSAEAPEPREDFAGYARVKSGR